jgi:hypothetical protein
MRKYAIRDVLPVETLQGTLSPRRLGSGGPRQEHRRHPYIPRPFREDLASMTGVAKVQGAKKKGNWEKLRNGSKGKMAINGRPGKQRKPCRMC